MDGFRHAGTHLMMEDNKNTGNQLEELKAENEHLKKESEQKTAWISLISHDFKGAFSSFLVLIEAWEQKSISDTYFFKLLPEVKHDIQKNLQTITDTGTWIKTQSDGFKLQRSEIYAVELYLHLKQMFQKKLKNKHLQFVFEGSESIKVQTDRLLIEFILKKIFDNAIKYSHPESSIFFKVTESRNETTFSITDQGIGMDQKQTETIFSFDSPVFRGTEGETGAGLSMKIIKKFVCLLDGIIEIESTINKGTIVSVFLLRN